MNQVTQKQMREFMAVLIPIQRRLIAKYGLKKFESWRDSRQFRLMANDSFFDGIE